MVSSREGANWLYYEDGSWKRQLLSIGEPKEDRQLPNSQSPGSGDHWGTGCADAGRIGDDPFAYIATLDPFHGTTACVLSKVGRGMKDTKWQRHILDIYGTPNQLMKYGTVQDTTSSVRILMPSKGPNPNKGIMYYKAIDVEKGLFAKWKIAEESSARIAIGNFSGTNKLDLISVEYNVPRYYEEPKPVITLHVNKFAKPKPAVTERHIVPTVWDNEGLVYLARPNGVKSPQSFPLIEVANYAISVEIHPPGAKIPLEQNDGIKVLYGSVADIEGTRSSLGLPAFPRIAPVTSEDKELSADKEKGVILLRIVSVREPSAWPKAEDVPVKTTFTTKELGLDFPNLKFTKVEDLWWGADFKGVDFSNMSGFYFRFQDDKSQIAHLQFWTAGPNVDCGVHNHGNDIFQEIHICLSPGTEDGGMWRLKEGKDPKSAGPDDFDKVPLPRLNEHGGLWYRDSYGDAVRGHNNVVSYPWHKWQGGEKGKNVDVWLALEFNPDLAQ
ncbi:FG-GAP repeat-containing protein [Colletotrichum tofieldiae]|nr:FG-GAP repeat-containing protein [Colletotrichum tofieldiae]